MVHGIQAVSISRQTCEFHCMLFFILFRIIIIRIYLIHFNHNRIINLDAMSCLSQL